MSLTKIQSRDPQTLHVHQALKHIPALGEEELKAIRAGLRHTGEAMAPILIDEEGHILDDTSRTNWLCAKARQLKEVLVRVCPAADVHMLIIRDLAHRRHLSKSAIAYLAVPHLEPALEAARMRQLENLRKNPTNHEPHSVGFEAKTMEQLAEELGFGTEMLRLAVNVRKAFADPKKYQFNVEGGAKDGAVEEMTLRAWFEPRLLRAFVGGEHENNRPMGLGGIIAGITAVKEGNREKFNPKNQGQLNLFERKVDVFGGWKYWSKLPAEDRKKHFDNFEDRLELLDDQQREELGEYFEKLAKKCRQVKSEIRNPKSEH